MKRKSILLKRKLHAGVIDALNGHYLREQPSKLDCLVVQVEVNQFIAVELRLVAVDALLVEVLQRLAALHELQDVVRFQADSCIVLTDFDCELVLDVLHQQVLPDGLELLLDVPVFARSLLPFAHQEGE